MLLYNMPGFGADRMPRTVDGLTILVRKYVRLPNKAIVKVAIRTIAAGVTPEITPNTT